MRRHGGPSRTAGWLLAGLMALVPAARGQDVTLNLENADVAALIDAVANITRKNFIVDPRVQGKVTVVSSTPMSDADVYDLFLSILRVHGYTAIEDGKVVRVLPLEAARSDAESSGRPAGESVVTRVVAVRNVAAAQLVPVLRPLVPETGHLAAAPASNAIVVTDGAANVARIAALVARIDATNETGIDVVPLAHASATEVVKVLGRLVEGSAEAAASGARISADERTNAVLLRGDQEARTRLRAAVARLDAPRAAGGHTHVLPLRYANAQDLVPVLEGVVKSVLPAEGPDGTSPAGSGGLRTTVLADEGANALIVTAPPDMLATLREVVQQLDRRRRQVLVEALIAEVSTDRAAEIGVQWRATGSPEESNAFGGTNFNLTGNGINQIGSSPGLVGDGLSLGFLDGSTTLLGTRILNLGALVRLLAADGRANILSTPSLVTLDNQEARIVVGQNVPFITGQFAATGAAQGAANPFQTIERQDVGITLRVRPRIKEGDSIRLDIEQEVSSLSANPTGTTAADLITNKRSITTTVLVDDRRIVVLGGLIQDDVQENDQRVPVLGDLPLLGRLFRYQRTETSKQNLMVFLTPTILGDSAAHVAATEAPYARIEAEQARRAEAGVPLVRDAEQPRLAPVYGRDAGRRGTPPDGP